LIRRHDGQVKAAEFMPRKSFIALPAIVAEAAGDLNGKL